MGERRSPPPTEEQLERLLATAGQRNWDVAVPQLTEEDHAVLRDPALVDLLLEVLAGKDRERRRAAAHVLGRAAHASRSRRAFEELIAHAGREKDKYIAGIALEPLSFHGAHIQAMHFDPPLPAEPLLPLARDPRWLIHQPALAALAHCAPDEVEETLLEAAGKDEYQACTAAVGLARMRTDRSRRTLERLLDHPKTDVRANALSSLVHRLGAGALPHCRRLAASRSWMDKYRALRQLVQHGTEEDVALVAKRVRTLATRRPKVEVSPSELRHLVPFLLRHPEHPETEKALAKLEKAWDELFPAERSWLKETAPDRFRGPV